MIDQIKSLMQKHDWFYDYSDDMGEWLKGYAESREIIGLMQNVDASQVPELLSLVPEELRVKWLMCVYVGKVSSNTHPPSEEEAW